MRNKGEESESSFKARDSVLDPEEHESEDVSNGGHDGLGGDPGIAPLNGVEFIIVHNDGDNYFDDKGSRMRVTTKHKR